MIIGESNEENGKKSIDRLLKGQIDENHEGNE